MNDTLLQAIIYLCTFFIILNLVSLEFVPSFLVLQKYLVETF